MISFIEESIHYGARSWPSLFELVTIGISEQVQYVIVSAHNYTQISLGTRVNNTRHTRKILSENHTVFHNVLPQFFFTHCCASVP